jgi:hypothetical protein
MNCASGHIGSLHIISSEILPNNQILDKKYQQTFSSNGGIGTIVAFSVWIDARLDRQSFASLLDPASRSTATLACTDGPEAA